MLPLNSETKDQYLTVALRANALITGISLLLIFAFMARESASILVNDGSGLFQDDSWYPTEGKFNLWPMLTATLLSSLGAIVLAFPLGLFAAIFFVFYCPRFLKIPFIRTIELYASLPSVLFGFWGLMHIVPIVNSWHPPGQSLLAGILILTLMIFPILALNIITGLESSSKRFKKLSESLSLSKSTYIWSILLPNNLTVMGSSTVLALGRAIGETMAVLMVCGNIARIPSSALDPVRTLTANIALEMSYAMDNHRSALFVTGLLLLLLVSLLVFARDLLKGAES